MEKEKTKNRKKKEGGFTLSPFTRQLFKAAQSANIPSPLIITTGTAAHESVY